MKEDIDSGLNAKQLEEKYELHLNSGKYYYDKIALNCWINKNVWSCCIEL